MGKTDVTTDEQRVKAFYEDLKVVYEKHGMYITSCGCCGEWPELIPEGGSAEDEIGWYDTKLYKESM